METVYGKINIIDKKVFSCGIRKAKKSEIIYFMKAVEVLLFLLMNDRRTRNRKNVY